jgi:uncharacterized protein
MPRGRTVLGGMACHFSRSDSFVDGFRVRENGESRIYHVLYKGAGDMKQLVEDIAKALVDIPAAVSVRVVEGEQATVFELKVDASDLGKVIGKQGRTVRAIRTILNGAGMKLNRRFTLAILE